MDFAKALVGLSQSFSAHVRSGERGGTGPILLSFPWKPPCDFAGVLLAQRLQSLREGVRKTGPALASEEPERCCVLIAGGSGGSERCIGATAFETIAEAIEIEIDDGRGVKREYLAEDQAAGDGNAEGPAQF